MPSDDPYRRLTTSQAARVAGYSAQYIRNLARAGKLPHILNAAGELEILESDALMLNAWREAKARRVSA